jgi:hypothetical protein
LKKIIVTRDSVAAGDDANAPHLLTILVKETDSIKNIIELLAHSEYIPKIYGGESTWSVASHQPLAVIAQQWVSARLIFLKDQDTFGNFNLDRIHFNYHSQDAPEMVLRVLSRYRTAAPD